MNKSMLWFLSVFLFGIAGTAAAQAPAEVQALADRWTSAYNSHKSEDLAALYTETAHLYIHGAPRREGREAIQSFWAADMQEENPLTLLTVTDSVNGIDMRLVHGNYQVIDRDTGVQLGAGRFAHIWLEDSNGKWLLDRDLWNQPYGQDAADD